MHFRLIPYLLIEFPERHGCRQVRAHEVQRQEMFLRNWLVYNLNHIEWDDRTGDDNCLSNFKTIDACENVDCVRAKHRQHAHVDVIKNSNIDRHAEQIVDNAGQDDGGGIKVDEIYRQQWKWCDGWQKKFVSPTKVEDVISETKQNHTADWKKCWYEFDELQYEAESGD